jgi:hypothetical protein
MAIPFLVSACVATYKVRKASSYDGVVSTVRSPGVKFYGTYSLGKDAVNSLPKIPDVTQLVTL